MAIDTRLKRQSAAGLKPFKKVPLPDGTIAATDRVLIACLYCGIAISGVVYRFVELTVRLYNRTLTSMLYARSLTEKLFDRSVTLKMRTEE